MKRIRPRVCAKPWPKRLRLTGHRLQTLANVRQRQTMAALSTEKPHRLESGLARAADDAEAATTEAERKIAEELRDNQAASIAASKRKAGLK